jgi:hypothetical protein
MTTTKRSTARRGLVAVAIAVGLVALSAAPASAEVPTLITGTITAGTNVFDVDDEEPHPCSSRRVAVTFAGTAASGTWAASGTIKAPFELSGTQYQAQITILNGPLPLPSSGGSYTRTSTGPPATYGLAGTLNVQGSVQALDTDGADDVEGTEDDCAKTNLCVIRARLVVDTSQSGHTGTLPTPGFADVTDLVADSDLTGGVRPVVVNGACPVTISSQIVAQRLLADLSLSGWTP